MAYVIGLDLGNFQAVPCLVKDYDEKTHLGGNVVVLLPDDRFSNGIPTAFFWNPNNPDTFLAGKNAVSGMAKPEKYRIRYLKRQLGKKLVIDGKNVVINGKEWTGDDALREVVQSILRDANDYLQKNEACTCTDICIAFPVIFTPAQIERFVSIVNSCKLNETTYFHVVKAIHESGAGALGGLVAANQMEKETTVAVYDMGGGTFDTALVSCYPEGRKNASGRTTYYDIHVQDGLEIGGKEFDEIIRDLFVEKLEREAAIRGTHLTSKNLKEVSGKAESLKRDLTTSLQCSDFFEIEDDDVQIVVTREEFNEKAKPLVKKTVDQMKKMIDDPRFPNPEHIILVGGSSQMPIVKEMLEEELPSYNINFYKPMLAIAEGAARFGAIVDDRDGSDGDVPKNKAAKDIVTRHTTHAIGIRFVYPEDHSKSFIQTVIPERSEVPFNSEWTTGCLVGESDYSVFSVYEATVSNPNQDKIDTDWRYIMDTRVDFGRMMSDGTTSETHLMLNELGIIKQESRVREGEPVVEAINKLNLS